MDWPDPSLAFAFGRIGGHSPINGRATGPTTDRRETMFRNALFASLIALGAAGAAQAQDHGPRLVGGGTDAQVVYAEPSRNLVGGGVASLSGGGDDRQIAYGPNPVTEAPATAIARLVGGGVDAQVIYEQPQASAASMLATGRGAQPRG
jgi:hypothetical protein